MNGKLFSETAQQAGTFDNYFPALPMPTSAGLRVSSSQTMGANAESGNLRFTPKKGRWRWAIERKFS